MQLTVLSINHQTAPLAVRERVAFPAENLAIAMRELMVASGADEAAILSTCNRTELYTRAGDGEAMIAWLARAGAGDGTRVAALRSPDQEAPEARAEDSARSSIDAGRPAAVRRRNHRAA